MAVPKGDAELVAWSTVFSAGITAAPTSVGLTAALATAYDLLHDAFVADYNAWSNDATRSKSLTEAKRASKSALLVNARALYQVVKGFPGATNQQKMDLGIHVNDAQPTPGPVPAFAPQTSIVKVVGNVVTLRMRDAQNSNSRGKPAGVDGVAIYSYVGAAAPTELNAWKFEGISGLTVQEIVFDDAAPGATVWAIAQWFNGAKETGPASLPISATIQYGTPMAA